MFVKQVNNANKINSSLLEETIEDIALYTKRLYVKQKNNQTCQVTINKFDKLLREGGNIESMLNIYVSDNIVSHSSTILSDLQSKSQNNAWWNINRTLLDKLKKTYGIKARWEHVSPVKLCVHECLTNYKKMPEPDFKLWIEDSIKNRWFICLITLEEDEKLKIVEKSYKRNQDNLEQVYKAAGINKVHHVRNDLL